MINKMFVYKIKLNKIISYQDSCNTQNKDNNSSNNNKNNKK